MLTQDKLKQALHYNPETGEFIKHFKSGKVKRVGTIGAENQRMVSVNGKMYQAKKLAWLYVYGVYPKFVIYHKNGNPDDDRISNLEAGVKGVRIGAKWEN